MRAPVPAALPAEPTLAEVAIGNHAEHHRVLDVDVAAERAGKPDAIDAARCRARSISSRMPAYSAAFASWIARTSFCVMLHRHVAAMQHIRERAVVGDDAIAARRDAPVDDAVLVDDAGEVHLRDDFDDAGAADARDAGLRRRVGESRVVRPEVAADHLVARLERHGIDAHALDRARRGALAAADLRAFERGPGRTRAGEQPVAIAEHDLGIGADVDQQRHFRVGDPAARRGSCRRHRRRRGRRCRAARRCAHCG